MGFEGFHRSVAEYYTGKITAHGATAAGVDWNSPESQALRFEQLLKIIRLGTPFSLNDYGCGYGALLDFLLAKGLPADYRGFDIAEAMLAEARRRHDSDTHRFSSAASELAPADYTVASGIFNVKLAADPAEWRKYVLATLHNIDALSTAGFAFNMLTSYSDPGKMREALFYGDPCFFFDYCKTHFSRNVALLHDYGLYEFTVLIRK